MTEQGQEARSSIDMDTVWKVKQSTVWDMRQDGNNGHGRWDFSRSEDRNGARRKLANLSPMLVIGDGVDVVLQNQLLNCL